MEEKVNKMEMPPITGCKGQLFSLIREIAPINTPESLHKALANGEIIPKRESEEVLKASFKPLINDSESQSAIMKIVFAIQSAPKSFQKTITEFFENHKVYEQMREILCPRSTYGEELSSFLSKRKELKQIVNKNPEYGDFLKKLQSLMQDSDVKTLFNKLGSAIDYKQKFNFNSAEELLSKASLSNVKNMDALKQVCQDKDVPNVISDFIGYLIKDKRSN